MDPKKPPTFNINCNIELIPDKGYRVVVKGRILNKAMEIEKFYSSPIEALKFGVSSLDAPMQAFIMLRDEEGGSGSHGRTIKPSEDRS